MDNLEPITREETLLDGGDLTPITRKEMFIKRIYDKTQSVPEPITREEYFLNKAGEGSGGDVTIEQLNVTENGTYSESGKAYSPVIVDVPTPPIPENAYLLNSLSGLPADIASFNDGTDLPMASLKVAVTPYQDLSHGDPSPDNICPIIGWDEAVVTRCGKNLFDKSNQEDGWYTSGSSMGHVAEIIAGSTSYACHKDIFIKGGYTYKLSFHMTTSNTLRPAYVLCDRNMIVLSYEYWSTQVTDYTFTISPTQDGWLSVCTANKEKWGECDIQLELGDTATTYEPYAGNTYTIDLDGTRYGGVVDATNGTMDDTLDHIASYNGEALPSTWISDRDVYAEGTTPTIGAEVVYTRATPITVQLAPTPVKSLEGENNICANCGQITEVKYFKKA